MTRTSTAISAAEAARLTGVDKSTITRAVKDGRFSAQKDINGRLIIEPAELFRVFPPLPLSELSSEPDEMQAFNGIDADGDGDSISGSDALADAHQRWRFEAVRRELEEMRRERDKEVEERSRERRSAEDTISDLRRRLDSSEEERRKKDTQVTHLLTDQREKAVAEAEKAVTAVAEAEKAVAAAAEMEKAIEEMENEKQSRKRGWSLFGRKRRSA
ncbi:helix-turn-helix domain-containing protein [Beijerinckia mobilis]|uniref:helix-turn-helix domain-containing protein n=1 Tax=Beijerinckia mobilis TaxID=231434 RepID=UPI000550D803|nr:helix-turn-helix domain-containing protein [Beijerinckia mobilis]